MYYLDVFGVVWDKPFNDTDMKNRKYISIQELETKFDLGALGFDGEMIRLLCDCQLISGMIADVTMDNEEGELLIDLNSLVGLIRLKRNNVEETLKAVDDFIEKSENLCD